MVLSPEMHVFSESAQAFGPAEGNIEPRALASGARSEDPPSVLSVGPTVTDRLDRITQRAESHPDEVFNNLFSVITDELLWTAFRRLKRNKAPGVDGVTVDQYEENLDANLRDLLTRLHRGTYRPHPSLRRASN